MKTLNKSRRKKLFIRFGSVFAILTPIITLSLTACNDVDSPDAKYVGTIRSLDEHWTTAEVELLFGNFENDLNEKSEYRNTQNDAEKSIYRIYSLVELSRVIWIRMMNSDAKNCPNFVFKLVEIDGSERHSKTIPIAGFAEQVMHQKFGLFDSENPATTFAGMDQTIANFDTSATIAEREAFKQKVLADMNIVLSIYDPTSIARPFYRALLSETLVSKEVWEVISWYFVLQIIGNLE